MKSLRAAEVLIDRQTQGMLTPLEFGKFSVNWSLLFSVFFNVHIYKLTIYKTLCFFKNVRITNKYDLKKIKFPQASFLIISFFFLVTKIPPDLSQCSTLFCSGILHVWTTCFGHTVKVGHLSMGLHGNLLFLLRGSMHSSCMSLL